MRFLQAALLSLVLLSPSAGMAAEECLSSYLDPSVVAPEMLPAPPAERTSAWNEQVKAVMAAQTSVRADDLTAMRNEQHMRPELMTGLLGGGFTRANLPQTFNLLDRVLADAACINNNAKIYWHTRRPFVADPRVKLMVAPVTSNAYPSGHTNGARVLAEVLGMLLPEKREVLRAQADVIAWHRVQAGVHYPNDLTGGNIEAMLTVGALLTQPGFQQDLAKARAELALTQAAP